MLLQAYKNADRKKIGIFRVMVHVPTFILFCMLLADDHVFEDSTVPQTVEMFMTSFAILRHSGVKGPGVSGLDMQYGNKTQGGN